MAQRIEMISDSFFLFRLNCCEKVKVFITTKKIMEAAKQFVLYAIPDERNSKKALYLSRPLVDQVFDPLRMRKRPSWLSGVPTIVDLKTKAVYEGTKCLLYMQKRNNSERIEITQPAEKSDKGEITQPAEKSDKGEITKTEEKSDKQPEEDSVIEIAQPEEKSVTGVFFLDVEEFLTTKQAPSPTLLQRPLIPDEQPEMIIRIDS